MKFNKEQNLYLYFSFSSSGLNGFFWGIMRENDSLKRNDVTWNQINAVMNAQFGSGSKPEEMWPWWSWIDKNKEFGGTFLNWNSSETPWISIKEKTLAGKITKLAIEVRDTFNEKQNLKLLLGEDPSNCEDNVALI